MFHPVISLSPIIIILLLPPLLGAVTANTIPPPPPPPPKPRDVLTAPFAPGLSNHNYTLCGTGAGLRPGRGSCLAPWVDCPLLGAWARDSGPGVWILKAAGGPPSDYEWAVLAKHGQCALLARDHGQTNTPGSDDIYQSILDSWYREERPASGGGGGNSSSSSSSATNSSSSTASANGVFRCPPAKVDVWLRNANNLWDRVCEGMTGGCR